MTGQPSEHVSSLHPVLLEKEFINKEKKEEESFTVEQDTTLLTFVIDNASKYDERECFLKATQLEPTLSVFSALELYLRLMCCQSKCLHNFNLDTTNIFSH